MQDLLGGKKLSLDMPVNYSIRVQGVLDESYFDRLGDMLVKVINREYPSPETTLSGRVRDQAQLMGILNSLYELHLPLLSVSIITKGNDINEGEEASGK
jgi:hypothetical protein